MHLPGFTAEEVLRNVEGSYQGAGSSSASKKRDGVVVPALTACQRQCRMDEAELFMDCITGCQVGDDLFPGSYPLCAYRCELARSVYIAKCDAQCKAEE